jgi:phosphohistidine phosphatase
MKLYLVQHAKAASKEIDPDRSLTEEGLRDIQKVAAFIESMNLSIDYLWHSGKKRAQQTARFLADVVMINKQHTACDGLAPNDDIMTLKNEIMLAQKDIMIVGHLPFLPKLASSLLVGRNSLYILEFRNAGIVCLNCFDDNQWRIDWMIIPEILA